MLKPNEVTDSELRIELGNLKAENERLQSDYTALLESSTRITNKLREEVREVRLQLERERADREEIEGELSDLRQKSATVEKDLPDAVDLSGKAGEVLSFIRTLLPEKKKLPSGTISKIEKILKE